MNSCQKKCISGQGKESKEWGRCHYSNDLTTIVWFRHKSCTNKHPPCLLTMHPSFHGTKYSIYGVSGADASWNSIRISSNGKLLCATLSISLHTHPALYSYLPLFSKKVRENLFPQSFISHSDSSQSCWCDCHTLSRLVSIYGFAVWVPRVRSKATWKCHRHSWPSRKRKDPPPLLPFGYVCIARKPSFMLHWGMEQGCVHHGSRWTLPHVPLSWYTSWPIAANFAGTIYFFVSWPMLENCACLSSNFVRSACCDVETPCQIPHPESIFFRTGNDSCAFDWRVSLVGTVQSRAITVIFIDGKHTFRKYIFRSPKASNIIWSNHSGDSLGTSAPILRRQW